MQRHSIPQNQLITGFVLSMLLGFTPAFAQSQVTYYVDSTTGNDGNSGVQTTPWKTVGRALSAVAPGQSIALRRGSTWLESIIPPRSGTKVLPITIGAYGGGNRPVISGASVRPRTLSLIDRSYIIVKDIDFRDATNNADGSVYIKRANGVQLLNVAVHDNYTLAGVFIQDSTSVSIVGSNFFNNRHSAADRGDGILIDGGGGNHYIEGNSSSNNTAHGIRVGFAEGSANNYIGYNSVHDNGSVGISCQIGSANTIIEYNVVYSNGQIVADTAGIDIFKPGNNNTARYNVTHDHRYRSLYAGGIRFDGGDFPGVSPKGNMAYGNIIYNERVGITALNFDNASAINNTIYNSGLYGIHIQGSDTDNFTAKNNIVNIAGTRLIYNDGATNSDIDYNTYYPDSALAFSWNDAVSGFSLWRTHSFRDAHAVSLDPLFDNAFVANFALQTASPCIGAGVFVSGLSSRRVQNIGAN